MDLISFLENLFGKKVDLITDISLSPYVRPHIEGEVKWYEI
jgi:predicted nucleotidyltransferase